MKDYEFPELKEYIRYKGRLEIRLNIALDQNDEIMKLELELDNGNTIYKSTQHMKGYPVNPTFCRNWIVPADVEYVVLKVDKQKKLIMLGFRTKSNLKYLKLRISGSNYQLDYFLEERTFKIPPGK